MQAVEHVTANPALHTGDLGGKATTDGYTLLMGAVHHTIATSVYPHLQYDFQKDFAPVTTVALVPNILVVNPKVPAQNVQEYKLPTRTSSTSNCSS